MLAKHHWNDSLVSSRNDHWTRRSSLLSSLQVYGVILTRFYSVLQYVTEGKKFIFSTTSGKATCGLHVQLSARFFCNGARQRTQYLDFFLNEDFATSGRLLYLLSFYLSIGKLVWFLSTLKIVLKIK